MTGERQKATLFPETGSNLIPDDIKTEGLSILPERALALFYYRREKDSLIPGDIQKTAALFYYRREK
jgi:hypothetical protein